MFRRWRLLLLLVLLTGMLVVLWSAADWPPPGLIVKHGLPPAGGPTGREKEVAGLTFVELSPGYFRMGSHDRCKKGDVLGTLSSIFGLDWGVKTEHDGTECPTHWVEVSEPFWIATTEVTNAIYEEHAYDHERCDYSSEDKQPAVRASWWAARKFCREYSEWSDEKLRLPTEAEWEYACRAGTSSVYFFGDDPERLGEFAHFEPEEDLFGNSEKKPAEIAGRKPNPWGLYDITGNVWEWCEDEGPTHGVRIFRGGGCRSETGDCRSASRRWTVPGRRIAFLGFRPVMTLPEE